MPSRTPCRPYGPALRLRVLALFLRGRLAIFSLARRSINDELGQLRGGAWGAWL
jgi:hypothetical protein